MTIRGLALEIEMDHPHIIKLEAGKVNPTLSTVISLAEALQVDPSELLS